MGCFWREVVRCEDTSCGNTTLIFATPAKLQNGADLATWPLTVFDAFGGTELFPTTARITHIDGYFPGGSGCEFKDWYADGDFSVAPPNTSGDPIISRNVTGVEFDPSMDDIPIGAVPGITGDGGAVYLDGDSMFIAFLTIETDLGVCHFVCGADYCE